MIHHHQIPVQTLVQVPVVTTQILIVRRIPLPHHQEVQVVVHLQIKKIKV